MKTQVLVMVLVSLLTMRSREGESSPVFTASSARKKVVTSRPKTSIILTPKTSRAKP